MKFNRPSENTGKYVKSIRQSTIAMNDGRMAFDILSILSPDIAEATKRFMP